MQIATILNTAHDLSELILAKCHLRIKQGD